MRCASNCPEKQIAKLTASAFRQYLETKGIQIEDAGTIMTTENMSMKANTMKKKVMTTKYESMAVAIKTLKPIVPACIHYAHHADYDPLREVAEMIVSIVDESNHHSILHWFNTELWGGRDPKETELIESVEAIRYMSRNWGGVDRVSAASIKNDIDILIQGLEPIMNSELWLKKWRRKILVRKTEEKYRIRCPFPCWPLAHLIIWKKLRALGVSDLEIDIRLAELHAEDMAWRRKNMAYGLKAAGRIPDGAFLKLVLADVNDEVGVRSKSDHFIIWGN